MRFHHRLIPEIENTDPRRGNKKINREGVRQDGPRRHKGPTGDHSPPDVLSPQRLQHFKASRACLSIALQQRSVQIRKQSEVRSFVQLLQPVPPSLSGHPFRGGPWSPSLLKRRQCDMNTTTPSACKTGIVYNRRQYSRPEPRSRKPRGSRRLP